MDWTERYRPRSLDHIVGNKPAITALRAWAAAWQEGRPEEPAMVLAGPPGTGKTSAALALANDLDWALIELNASDARNAERIRRVATAGALHQTFGDDGAFHSTDSDGGRKLIVLDEADNLYERLSGENAAGGSTNLGDKGGKAQIIDTIRRTAQPIILIVNDLYALQKGSGASLKSLAKTVKFTRVHSRSIPPALARILQAEGIDVEPAVLDAVAGRAGGDLRAAVRDLETLCAGRERVTVADLEVLGKRDVTGNMFDLVRDILQGSDIQDLRRQSMDAEGTPEDLVLWVDENLPKAYEHPEDLVAGYEMLSRADVFLGRTRSTQNYRLWAYASDLAAGGVSAVASRRKRGYVPIGFPQWLSKMSRSRGARAVKTKLTAHVGAATHQSRRKAGLHQVDVVEQLCQADDDVAARIVADMELEADEVAVLLGEGTASRRVKAVMGAAAALSEDERSAPASAPRGSQAALETKVDDGKAAKKLDKPEPSGGQSTLF